MTERSAVRRRFQYSIRSLLVVTGLMALLLTPVAWMVRQRERLRLAHEEAMRSILLEKQYRAGQRKWQPIDTVVIDRDGSSEATEATPPNAADATAEIERLRRENADLRKTVESLRGEIQRLKVRNP